jgi:hypothetical protein
VACPPAESSHRYINCCQTRVRMGMLLSTSLTSRRCVRTEPAVTPSPCVAQARTCSARYTTVSAPWDNSLNLSLHHRFMGGAKGFQKCACHLAFLMNKQHALDWPMLTARDGEEWDMQLTFWARHGICRHGRNCMHEESQQASHTAVLRGCQNAS